MVAAIATWSGGKDSCLAAYSAMRSGYEIRFLANTISRDFRRVRFHGVTAETIAKQAHAMGVPLLQQETSPETYEEEFKANLRQGLDDGVSAVVFGDIHLRDCFAWAQRICGELGVDLVEPLFGRDPLDVLRGFVSSGFRAVVVSTQAALLGEEWIGRAIDEGFISDVSSCSGVDPCGENGEYHSLVVEGPLFSRRLIIDRARPVLRDGYWFLDIRSLRDDAIF
jgi:uncharacterized protein (TIGR00290 family)